MDKENLMIKEQQLEDEVISEATSIVEENEVKEVEEQAVTKEETKKIKATNNRRPMAAKKDPFERRVVQIKRISKTTKGGRSMRFSALVVIGDKNGRVGFGMGKSIEVPDAIKKAVKNANNNIYNLRINKKGTVYHENIGHDGAGRILVKPAPLGTGIIAGGSVRAVVELAGYHDIYTKCLGSNTPINVIRATIDALVNQYDPRDIAKLRDKKLSDL